MAGARDKFELDFINIMGTLEFEKLRKIEAEQGFSNIRETLRFAIGLASHSAPNPAPSKYQRTAHVK